tara:strand:- start:2692 stop:3357 length:666 start_codon:yes stop_codon:yes gene_type:complete
MIIANIATIPEREELLKKTIKSLEGQVEVFFICLNGHKSTPEFLKNRPDVMIHMDNNTRGDAGKFWLYCFAHLHFAKWFFCDDDIIYPKDYISRSLDFLDEYPNEVLTYHGKTFKKPITRYYSSRDRLRVFHCTQKVLDCEVIDVPGSGVMFMNSGTLKMNWGNFKHPNMADIWIYKFTQKQGVNVRICPHDSNWIIAQQSKGIYEDNVDNDSLQVEVFNS